MEGSRPGVWRENGGPISPKVCSSDTDESARVSVRRVMKASASRMHVESEFLPRRRQRSSSSCACTGASAMIAKCRLLTPGAPSGHLTRVRM